MTLFLYIYLEPKFEVWRENLLLLSCRYVLVCPGRVRGRVDCECKQCLMPTELFTTTEPETTSVLDGR
jgi:hypothetical protein